MFESPHELLIPSGFLLAMGMDQNLFDGDQTWDISSMVYNQH